MSDGITDLDDLQKAKAATKAHLNHLKRKNGDVPVDSDCWREVRDLIKEGEKLFDYFDQEEANLILGAEWDTCSVRVDREQVNNLEKKQQQATAPSQSMDLFSALEDEK